MAEITGGKPPDKLTAKQRQQVRAIGPVYRQAIDTLHSCYNLACLLYLDGAVDRDRFREQHERDVRELLEDGTAADRELLASVVTPYKALRAVYIEWLGKRG